LECINPDFAKDEAAFGLQMAFPVFLLGFVFMTIFLRRLAHIVRRKIAARRTVAPVSSELQSEDEAHLILEKEGEEENAHLLEKVRRDGSPTTFRNLLIKSFLFVFYVGYFDLTNTIFSVFNCVSPSTRSKIFSTKKIEKKGFIYQ
jgi:hypothetical protein